MVAGARVQILSQPELHRLLNLLDREIRRLIAQDGNMTWKLLAIRAGCIRLGLIRKYD